jgi:hypothetical protein
VKNISSERIPVDICFRAHSLCASSILLSSENFDYSKVAPVIDSAKCKQQRKLLSFLYFTLPLSNVYPTEQLKERSEGIL